MKTIFEICKSVADMCLTARPKALEGEWADLAEKTLESINDSGVEVTEELLTLGMMWRWLLRHNRPYSDELIQYCNLLGDDNE